MKFSCGIEIGDEVKALLFDLDGTLVDNMQIHIDAWVQTGTHYGLPITPEMIQINAGIPTRQLIVKLASENDWKINTDDFTKLKQSTYRKLKANAGPIKKIEPIIQIVRHYYGKIPMTIGTGSSRINAIGALQDAEIIDCFDLVVSADDVDNPKPHPEIWLKGTTHIGIDPKDCLVFEDGEKGMEAADAAGIPWIDVRKHL